MAAALGNRILLVSESEIWREAMTIALEETGAVLADANGDRSVKRAQTFKPSAIVIDIDGEMLMQAAPDRVAWASHVALALRGWGQSLPIIMMTSVPIDELNRLASGISCARVTLANCLDTAKQAQQIRAALNELCSVSSAEVASSFATIEITIAQATLQCDIRAGGKSFTWGPETWRARNGLVILDDEFSNYESSREEFARLGVKNIDFAGRRLLQDLFKDPLTVAYDFCRSNLPGVSLIHHRFVLEDGDLEFVPFEIVATANPGEYLRFVYPLARRLISHQQIRDADHIPEEGKPRLRVLFIVSKASGILKVPNLKFKTKDYIALGELEHVDHELELIRALYPAEHFKLLTLLPDVDNITAIKAAFATNTFEIVHFAGHSVRADVTGRVFLALPAAGGKPVIPYDAEDFARLASEGETRLVILSSCEGTSGLALSRMASRGVPAVAGFRWPVDDDDASLFTAEFHRELHAQGTCVPVPLAFHRALLTLKEHSPGRLTGFSPILMIQGSTWHDFTLEG
jgi:hypothetical protein